MSRLRHTLYLAAIALSLMVVVPLSYAETDPRMVVEVVADEEGNVPSVPQAIRQALPLLWDRIIDSKARGSLPTKMKATQFVQRVVPGSDVVQVTFNEARVWQYLDQHQVAYLKRPPRMNLMIQLIKQNGSSMPQTAELLYDYSESIAQERGFLLSKSDPSLIIAWRWIDASQVNLVVRGNSALAEFSETRTITAGDPLNQLQAWTKEILLAARDAHITASVQPDQTEPAKKWRDGGIEVEITIEQLAALPAQVALEDALRQHEKVESITPTYLSASGRSYRLVLKGEEDAWVPQWFQRRGMQTSPTPHGWLIH